jgi:predicted permease
VYSSEADPESEEDAMRQLTADIRYALRQLRRTPGFAITAALTLALGIGANSTILSWISATLFNPIPGAASTDRMLHLQRGERSEHPTPPLSYPDFVDLRANVKSFSGMIAEHQDYISITGSGKPERIYGELTSADYFEVLGVQPYLGRTLISTRANERAGAPIAVLSYTLWQHRFAGDPGIIGHTIELNRHPYTIVGVTPKGFRGVMIGLRSDIFLPLGMTQQVWGWNPIDNRSSPFLNVIGVLRPGVNQHQADNELNVLMQRLVAQYPEGGHQAANQMSTDPLWRSPFGVNVYMAGTLPILLGLAAVLLLLACANVANLLLVRSVMRRREFAIRMSMGAGRWVLIRQLIIENLVIALIGGALALSSTLWTSRALTAFVPSTLPLVLDGNVDPRVMLATILVSLLTAVISGLVPAVRASRLSPVTALKDEALSSSGGTHKSRLTSGLVVVQIALSLLMLTCAGLFVRSLENAQKADPGFDANRMLLMTFDVSQMGYTAKTEAEFERQVIARVRQLPGVESATLADFSPLSFTIHSDNELPEGYVRRPHEDITVDLGHVGSGYLGIMRTPVRAGRDFTYQDMADTPPVAIVNQAFVDRYWPGKNAIGKRVYDGHQWSTVVGVAANGKYRRLIYDPTPLVLFPFTHGDEAILHVRTSREPMAMAAAVERTIHGLNGDVPIYNITTLRENLQMGSVFERIAVTFAGSFGLLALLLAAVGIYGVVSYTTRQRTHEIGIRIALGAGKGDIFRNVLRQGLILTIFGLTAGVVAALFLTRFLRSMLFGVGTTDLLTFATVTVVLCAVALFACYLPARRATAVNPVQALRTQ